MFIERSKILKHFKALEDSGVDTFEHYENSLEHYGNISNALEPFKTIPNILNNFIQP